MGNTVYQWLYCSNKNVLGIELILIFVILKKIEFNSNSQNWLVRRDLNLYQLKYYNLIISLVDVGYS